MTHTPESPRDEYDELAALTGDLQGRMLITRDDFDLQSAGRDYEAALIVAGYPDVAARIHVLTEVLVGQLPCGHEPPAVRTTLREDPEIQAMHARVAADTGERHDLDDVIAELGIDVSDQRADLAERFANADRDRAALVDQIAANMHEPPGPPVDGREVDRAPMAGPKHAWLAPTWAHTCHCYIGRDHTENPQNYESRVSIKTGGGAGVVPPDPAPSPHLWLRDSEHGDPEHCHCLIGDDHVAEPRFEKES